MIIFTEFEGETAAVVVGDYSKVHAVRESFWLKVLSFDGDYIVAVVQNELIETEVHGLKYGDIAVLEPKHVKAVMPASIQRSYESHSLTVH